MRTYLLCLLALAACGDATDDKASDSDTDATASTDTTSETDVAGDTDESDVTGPYTVRVSVSGLEGAGLTLALNDGIPLGVSSNAQFSFPTKLDEGATYAITVVSQPTCPAQVCTLTGDTGTITGHVTDATVTCEAPVLTLAASSWDSDGKAGELPGLRITDDLGSYADDDTVTPRKVEGNLTTITLPNLTGNIAVDPGRDAIYLYDGVEILRFSNASTVTGNTAPDAVIRTQANTFHYGICAAPALDMMFMAGSSDLSVLHDVSTLDGTGIVPDAIVSIDPGTRLTGCDYDAKNDRLFVGGYTTREIYVFDDASTLTSASTPDRTITWTQPPGPQRTNELEYDTCTDRLYIGSTVSSANGGRLWVLANASTLDGEVDLNANAAQVSNIDAKHLALDPTGNLWVMAEDGTDVVMFEEPDQWTGLVDGSTPDLTLKDVVFKSEGFDVYVP